MSHGRPRPRRRRTVCTWLSFAHLHGSDDASDEDKTSGHERREVEKCFGYPGHGPTVTTVATGRQVSYWGRPSIFGVDPENAQVLRVKPGVLRLASMTVTAVLFALFALAGCHAIIQPAMRRQIGEQERCPTERVEVLEMSGSWARVRVCGQVKTCRYSQDVNSWLCR